MCISYPFALMLIWFLLFMHGKYTLFCNEISQNKCSSSKNNNNKKKYTSSKGEICLIKFNKTLANWSMPRMGQFEFVNGFCVGGESKILLSHYWVNYAQSHCLFFAVCRWISLVVNLDWFLSNCLLVEHFWYHLSHLFNTFFLFVFIQRSMCGLGQSLFNCINYQQCWLWPIIIKYLIHVFF